MTHVTVDASTLARMNQLADLLEFRNEQGQVLGYFHPLKLQSVKSPLTRDELEQRRKDRTGRPLSEVIRDLSQS